MTKEEYRKAIDEVIYLCACAVNGDIPDKKHTDSVNLEYLYKAACKHNLCAIVGYALESAGILDHEFIQARAKAIRKVTVMEIDKQLLFERFEQEGIWYMPLKGAIIKDFYPSIGMRQMSDFDILFDSSYQKKVKDIFLELGFTCKQYCKGNNDVYYKKPVSNFEMHTGLFAPVHQKSVYNYYCDIKPLMLKDENNAYGYHLNSNDFYVYINAHEYKHYSNGGTGLRSLLDIYVILQRLGNELDYDYIRTQTDKLGITAFEQQNKKLALSLLGGKELSETDRDMLEYIIYSGTYGNIKNSINHKVERLGGGKKGKRDYILSRIFMPMEQIKEYYPFFYRHKIFLPCLVFYRLGRAATVSRKETKSELKILLKKK